MWIDDSVCCEPNEENVYKDNAIEVQYCFSVLQHFPLYFQNYKQEEFTRNGPTCQLDR